jgi:peptidoglycan/LPS O-acetylase OafA/YrhL
MNLDDNYLEHLDGLRAVAVILVILFHLEVPYFDGGFIGVDMFFVISGFLITRILVSRLESTGSIDFKLFYTRRIRRLVPALAAMLFSSTIAAVSLLSTTLLQEYGQSLWSATLSISNVFFWSKEGYFSTNNEYKPLLHTWSLSVEEQFYLFWPLTLFWTRARNRHMVIAISSTVSVFLCIVWHHGGFDVKTKSTVFYLAPFRIYEFGVGAHLAELRYLKLDRLRPALLGNAGWTLLLASVTGIRSTTPFPYVTAYLPCFATALLIMGGKSGVGYRFLTHSVVRHIGRLSYSLYLYHWPIIVFYKYYKLAELSYLDLCLVVSATFICAEVSYHCIEKPFRLTSSNVVREGYLWPGMLGILTIIGVSGVAMQFSVLKGRSILPVEIYKEGLKRRSALLPASCDMLRLNDSLYCDLSRPIQIFVFGDSHETDAYIALHEIFRNSSAVDLLR